MNLRRTYLLSLLVIAIVSSAQVKAQFEQGDVFSSFRLGFNQLERNTNFASTSGALNERITEIVIAPSINAFVSRKVSMGVGLNYSKTTIDIGDELDVTDFEGNLLLGSLQIRPHQNISDKFATYLNFALEVGGGKSNQRTEQINPFYPGFVEIISATGKIWNVRSGVSPGLIFFVSNKFALNAQLGFFGYEYYEEKYLVNGTEFINDEKSISANIDMSSFLFGIDMYFGRSKKKSN